jgi:uncharacterized membrane protein YjdF
MQHKERKMKRYIGIALLILLIPLWIVLYAIAWLGEYAHVPFNALYQPIYKLAGKPLDTK